MNREALQTPMELLLVGGTVQAGIFETLHHSPMTDEELASRLSLNRRAVWTVMEALVALGYLIKKEEKYALSTEVEETFFKRDSMLYSGFSFMHGYELTKRWLELPAVLKTGSPARRERGSIGQRYFIEAMASNARLSAPEIASFCLAGLPVGARVLDIGGGPLTHARAFAGRGAQVTVLDAPEVVEMMQPTIREGESIAMIAGDFTVALPPGPYHLAYLGNICHIYGEKENRALFQRVAAELVPGGRIAIVDFVRGEHPFAALFAVNMLINTERGGTWTLAEYTCWLTGAGFLKIELHNVTGRQVITALKE